MDLFDLLDQRRSVPAMKLAAPGPDAAQLARMLRSAVRAPDHGKLTPWRLIVLEGDARIAFADRLAAIALADHPELPEAKRAKDHQRYEHAPLIIAVVATIDPTHPKVPAQEQLLSAGCVAYNLLFAAQAAGFAAQLLTGWAAYDTKVGDVLGLGTGERVIGFVYVGTPTLAAPERERPAIADKVTRWTP